MVSAQELHTSMQFEIRMKWDLRRTVGSDQSFNALSESHLQSQLRSWLSAQDAEMALTTNNRSQDYFHPDSQIPLSYEQVTENYWLAYRAVCSCRDWTGYISLLLVIRRHLQTAPSGVNSTGAPANTDVALYSRTSIIRISRLPGLFPWSQFAHEYFSISHDQDP